MAAYPPIALKEGRGAKVKMTVLIDEIGVVRKVSVLESGGGQFDDPAVEALYGFRFSPACTNEGRPVATQIVYQYNFLVVAK